jgi:uncharacterized membrane protein
MRRRGHSDRDLGPRPRTERGLDRLVNFADATVAIAITVLILPLVDIAASSSDTSFGALVRENRSALIGFTITFVVIARLWTSHHRVFENVDDYDAGLVRWTFAWLFSIVVFPFAANVLSNVEDFDDVGVFALYIGTILLATVTVVGTEVHLQRHPELARADAGPIETQGGFVMIGLVTIALVLAMAVPAINLWALVVLLLSGPIDALIDRLRARRA